LIICSDDQLEVGKHYVDGQLTDIQRQWQSQPFVVLSTASEDEYLNYCRSYGFPVETLASKPFYYRVSTD